MPLDPRAERLLHMLAAAADPLHAQTAEDRRRSLSGLTASVGGPSPPIAEVGMLQAETGHGPLRIRRYRPTHAGGGGLVFFHGGGWVAGDLDTHDGVCRRLAEASACQLLAVEYRLAPEHPFPAGLMNAVDAIGWVADCAHDLGLDRGKLVVAGDSAGGDLAAAACLMLRDQGGPAVALQLLICPILDLEGGQPSREAFAEGYFLSRTTLARDVADYLPDGADPHDPRLSPLRAPDLSKLPPTHIHVAEFDPFRDEGLAFAARLEAAGVPVAKTLHPGMIHYFYAMAGAIPYAEKALAEIGAAVKAALYG